MPSKIAIAFVHLIGGLCGSDMAEFQDPFWLSLMPKIVKERLSGREGVLSVAHNFGWLIFDKGIRLSLGLLIGAWIARYLGPGQYGELAYVLALVSFIQPLANLGMDNIVIRDISRDKQSAGVVLGTVFDLRILLGFLCWVGVFLFAGVSYGFTTSHTLLAVLIGATLVTQAFDVIDLWFQSQSQNRRTVFSKLIAYLISSAIKVFLIVANMPLVYFGAVLTVEAAISAVALLIAYRHFGCGTQWRWVSQASRRMFSESWPLMLSCLSIAVYLRFDQIVVKHVLGVESVGVYAVAVTLAMLGTFIPMLMNASIAPFLARKKQENELAYKILLANIFKYYAVMGWVISVSFFYIVPVVIDLLFGKAYEAGVTAARIYGFVNLFVWMDAAQALWVSNERKPLVSLIKTFFGAVICVLLSLVLVPIFGILGGALAALCAQIFNAVLVNVVAAPSIFRIQCSSIFFIGFMKKVDL